MADSKLSALTAATDLTSAEFYVAQSGASKRAPVALLTKSVVGLGNVDNTSDANKPVSTAAQTALDAKAPLASPTFTGTVTAPNLEVTSNVITAPSAMGALSINVTERLNTKSVSADSTFTFSATPTTNAAFGLRLTEGGSAARTITIPSSYSQNRGSTITSFTLPANATVDLVWHYDGTTYYIYGDPVTAAQQKTALGITVSDVSGVMPFTKGGTGLDALGTSGQLLAVNATEDGLEYVDPSAGSGDVTAASNFGTDNRVLRSDGTTKGVQASSVEIDDSGNIGPVSDSIPNHVAFWDGHATAPKAVRFTAPTTVTTEYTVVWPAAPGTSGQILSVASVAGTTLTLQWSTP